MAKQKIFNRNGSVFAYEFLFRDQPNGIQKFPKNLVATSNVLLSSLTNIDINTLTSKGDIIFLNVDEKFLESGMVDMLDKNRFLLEILETTQLNDNIISRIKQYHKRGFKIAIDDFDCSPEMLKQFAPIFKYLHLVKIDVVESEPENLKNIVDRLKKSGIKILAEKIETQEEYEEYLAMGFNLFQGYYLDVPELITINTTEDSSKAVLLNLIKLVRSDADTEAIHYYIKQKPELSIKLIKFLNNHENFETKIESIIQVITLLGRDKLLRWLLLYLYSDMVDTPLSESILNFATKRAESMEALASDENKDKAYLAGMFSMIGTLFDCDTHEVIKDIDLDKDITDLVLKRNGIFLSSLIKAEESERSYLKKLLVSNLDTIDPMDIVHTLSANGIDIDKQQL